MDRRRVTRRILQCFAAATVLVGVASAVAFSTARRGLVTPTPSTLLLDRTGQFLGELEASDGELGYWPLPDPLPHRLVVATLETEDRRFFEHPGVAAGSVLRAAWQNVRNGRVISGASTVAMQVARMQWPARRSLRSKAREAFEALRLVRDHGHDAVLRQYLTLAPYGHRVHGAERAARLYFDRPLADLSWLQAAFLAGLPQQPGRFSPWTPKGRERALARARRIVRAMHARGVLSADELRTALESDLAFVDRPQRDTTALHPVLSWAGEARHLGGGTLQTTLDLDLQHAATRLLRQHLMTLAGTDAGNAAAIVLDARNAEVLAWVGSADYFDTTTHGAIDFVRTARSPGSTLKPFIYGLAMQDAGFTAATPVPDVPVEFASVNGVFLPENASHGFLGPMLVRQALANSRNIPALRALEAVGVDRFVRFLASAGIELPVRAADEAGLAMALGAVPLTLEQVAGLYAALAHDGEWRPLRRFQSGPAREPTRVLAPDLARMVTHMLADDAARRPTFTPGGPLDFPYAAAVKTGTSEGNRDAWTFAWTERHVVGVWVGNHDWRQMHGVSGAVGAAELARALMDHVTGLEATPPPSQAPRPAGWESRNVCPVSGGLAGPFCPHRVVESFAPGTAPVHDCASHRPVALDIRNGLRAGPGCPPAFVRHEVMLDLPRDVARHLRREGLAVAPFDESPLCGGGPSLASVQVVEPRAKSRYRHDPGTPADAAGIRLAAEVSHPDQPVLWLVDDVPVAEVGYPHELRWAPTPGVHVVRAAYARLGVASAPVEITVTE